MVFASNLITCEHCGRIVTGELKTMKTRSGEKSYTYYRCARYSLPAHPRIRLREEEFERQVLQTFEKLRIDNPKVQDWFKRVLQARSQKVQNDREARVVELTRQRKLLRNQQERLLNLRLGDEIDEQTFASKQTELRDRLAEVSLQIERYCKKLTRRQKVE